MPAGGAGAHAPTGVAERQSGAVRQLLLVLVSTGVQHQIGNVALRAISAPPPSPHAPAQSKLTSWLKGSSIGAATSTDEECALFGAVDIAPEELQRIVVAAGARIQRVANFDSDDALQLAISHSSKEVSLRLRLRVA